MQQAVAFDQIKFRAARIRLPLTVLARKAGMPPSTACRIGCGDTTNPHVKTIERLSDALRAEEAALRRHLHELERSREGRQLDLVDVVNEATGGGRR
jgi:transcriptional regulator with XRE-family HTH domain